MRSKSIELTDAEVMTLWRQVQSLALAPIGECLTEDDEVAYAAESLPEERQQIIEAHAESCPRCSEKLAGLLEAAEPWFNSSTGEARLSQLRTRLLRAWAVSEGGQSAKPTVAIAPVLPSPVREAAGWLSSWARAYRLPHVPAYAAAAILLTLIAGLWLLGENVRLRQELAQAHLHEGGERLNVPGALDPEAIARNSGAPNQSTPHFIGPQMLIPGAWRGRGPQPSVAETNNQLVLPPPPAPVTVNLQLKSDDYPAGYQATLEAISDGTVHHFNRLASEPSDDGHRVVTVQLSVTWLKNGDAYVIRLRGLKADGSDESVADYMFEAIAARRP